jgi:perosamine synthetase
LSNTLRAMAGVRRLAAQTAPEELSGLTAPDYERRLPGSLARLALVQLRRTGPLTERRRAQAARYKQIWQQSPWVDDLLDGADPLPTLLRYPIAVRDLAARPHLRAGLLSMGIEPGEWFDDVVHPAGSLGHGYVAGQCPNGERLARSIVNLPLGLHAELSSPQEAAMRRLAASPSGVLSTSDRGARA